jgi:peptide/nickel transport system permease protein
MTGAPLPEPAASPTTTEAGVPSTARPPRPRWRETLGLLLHNPTAAVAGLLLLGIVLVALLDETIAPTGPNEVAIDDRLQPPSLAHPFGTDDLGRDILSRVVLGAAVSLRVGFLAVAFALVVGTVIGLLAGFYGRWVDDVLMRAMDVLFAFPAVLPDPGQRARRA